MACSTAPNSQKVGSGIGTALVLGGLATYPSKEDKGTDEYESDKDKAIGLLVGGVLTHYVIGKIRGKKEKMETNRLNKKMEIVQKQIKERNKYYKNRYKAKDSDINSFLKYYDNIKYSIKPYMYSPNKGIKYSQSYPSLKVTPIPPYKSSFIDLTIKECKETKRITTDDYSNKMENFSAKFFGVNLKILDVTMKCKRTPSQITEATNFLKKIGIKENSEILNEASKKDFIVKFRTKSEEQFSHPAIGAIVTGTAVGRAIGKAASDPVNFSSTEKIQDKQKNKFSYQGDKNNAKRKDKNVKGVKSIKENWSDIGGKWKVHYITCNSGAYYKYYRKDGEWNRQDGALTYSAGHRGKNLQQLAEYKCK